MSALRSDMTVNDVIRLFPVSVEVFQRFGIDACCGGALPLLAAAARHRVDEDTLLNALASGITLQTPSQPPTDAPAGGL